MSLGDVFDTGDEVKVLRGEFKGEVGIVISRLKVHDEYVYVRLQDDDELHAFLDAELKELTCDQ